METVAEFTNRIHNMPNWELKTTRRDLGRIIANTTNAGELVDLNEWHCYDALADEINERRI